MALHNSKRIDKSEMIESHDGDIHRMAAELTDLQHAHSDRQAKSELIVSGLPPAQI